MLPLLHHQLRDILLHTCGSLVSQVTYMPPRKGPTNVVEIDSSSDDDVQGGARNSNTNGYSTAAGPKAVSGISASLEGPGTVSQTHPIDESRSFWKAGNYDASPTAKFNSNSGRLPVPFNHSCLLFYAFCNVRVVRSIGNKPKRFQLLNSRLVPFVSNSIAFYKT